ncbi:peptidoglycan-associated lipoprotein Pal [Marinimicrobium sp. ARAG 43.8]|uniref:peptidoglycan-associated lipoprotein Pal n=1 Tax=Marinimicrobium sp. ARAG 43.8 TaxID=3418719 RepID=UPI003CE94741
MTSVKKQGLTLAFVMAFLAGCSSTDTTEDTDGSMGADGQSGNGVSTGMSDRDSVTSRSGSDDDMEELDTIIYFDFDQATLKPDSRALLLAHAERLKESPTDVRLEGHADERGSREYNMALGERRANAVRDFLVLQGVRRSDLEVVSYGEERPVAMGSNDRAWERNRRVEIKY